MPWTRKLANKIKLKDGRTIGTLNQARELLLSIPPPQRETSLWRYIAKALDDAASERASVEEVQAMLIRGLKIAGLL
jgi:hypothetical protein